MSDFSFSDLFSGAGDLGNSFSIPDNTFGGSSYDPLTGSGSYGGSSTGDYNPVTGTGTYSGGSSLPSTYDPVSGGFNLSNTLGNLKLGSLGSGGSGSSLLSGLQSFISGNPANGGVSGLGPYAAVGALGISQAKDVQSQEANLAKGLTALGQPYTDAGKQLLTQFQGGKLRPDQQAVVDTTSKFSSDITASATPLGKIAQQAFADYNSGNLNPADQAKLDQQVASQKQQARQQMASAGITDSSVLDAQDRQIDNQAMITKQNLIDQRFATGNQAYDEWLKTTTEGQQLKIQGQQFASQSFETMLNDSLGLASEGMQPAMQAIQLQIQSDTELSQTVSDLLGNLASAYSYAQSGPGRAAPSGGGGGGGGGGGSGLGGIISGIAGIFGF